VKLPLGGNSAVLIRLTSTGLKPYQQLIDLNVTGLPAGVEASFSQARLSPLQPVLLTLKGTSGDQVVLIDGNTNNTPDTEYPASIVMPVRIIDGQDNIVLTAYLQGIDTSKFTAITPGLAATVTTPEIPNFALKIPDGATLTGADGRPIDKINVRTVSVDRLPIRPLPEGVNTRTVYLYYFFRPGGATPSTPIPVTMNNDTGSLPGEKVDLYYYDESPTADPSSNQWRIMGKGTVSDDGKSIVSDPGVGIPKFCCGATFASPPPPPPPPGGDGCGATGGNPVDLASGIGSVFDNHSLGLTGLFPINIACRYNSMTNTIGPFGRGTYLSYNWQARPAGTAITLITPDGVRYNLALDAGGIYRATDGRSGALGIQATITGNLITVRFPNGSKYEFPRSGPGNQQLTAITDPNGNRINLSRDTTGRVTVLTDAKGRLYQFSYSGNLITQVTDPIGRTLTLTYDGSSRLIEAKDPLDQKTQYAYDTNHRVIQKTDTRGAITNYSYDANGRTTEETLPDGSKYQFAYTVSGGTVAQTQVTDPNGNATTIRFNGQGYEVKRIDALGRVTTKTVDYARNQVLAQTDPIGRITRYTYDQNGNTTSVKDPDGNLTLIEYDLSVNKPSKITDALGHTVDLLYDGKGNLKNIKNGEGETTNFTYTPQGKLASITDPLGHASTFTYDADGNLIESEDALSRVTRNQYDTANRLIDTINAQGHLSKIAYDALNRPKQLTDALGQLTSVTYDEKGNLLSITDPKTVVIETNTYDLRNRLTEKKDALNRLTKYTYDGNSNLRTLTDRKNQTTQYIYDALNRPIKRTDADGRTTDYIYDLAGNVSQILDSQTGEIRYSYDNLNRMISETSDQGVISYSYDVTGKLTERRINGQDLTTYAYDKANRLTTITYRSQTVIYTYDGAGRLTQRTLPNGVSQTYSYNDANELLSITYKKADGTVIDTLNYDYDLIGNRLVRGRSALNSVQETGFSATYDAQNRMLTYNGKTLTYDENGNLTQRDTDTGAITFTWDARNQLTNITGPNGSASFKYDAMGRRIQKTINGTTTTYLYDRNQAIGELQGSSVGTTYLTGLQIDEVLARYSNTNRTFLTDALGSVIAQTDDTQTAKTQYGYSPFGETQQTGETSEQPYQYTARENDNVGVYYYRARYFDPQLKRFLSEDPIGLAGGINNYLYAKANSLRYIDPYGLWAWGDPLPQGLVDATAGFGDGLSSIFTFGVYSTADLRADLGIDGGVNKCSGIYTAGKYAGYAWGIGTLWAAGLNGGANSAFWAGRGASQTAATMGTTIGQTPIGAILGGLGVENRIVWTVASATFAANASGTATAVIRYVGPNSIWMIERAILNLRNVPIIYR
jgi:RHS repeat-associated protein